jgi:hypothetical protein
VIETRLSAEADVRQTHAAGWAVIVGTTTGVWGNGWESGMTFETVFGIVMRDA